MSRPAVIAARTDDEQPDTTEIAALADAAGYAVERELTQVRPEDAATNLGSGKVEELHDACRAVDADAAVLDVELTPRQTFELADRLPEGVEVYDRRRLILAIFAAQASTKRASLEIELARLRWELERRREHLRRGGVEYQAMQTIRDPEGEYVREVKDRIDEVKRQLQDCPDRLADLRARRREAGFDHVALAGYTNAGKSTLLHRLADDLDVDDTIDGVEVEDGPVEDSPSPADHPEGDDHTDLGESTAAAEDRLFKTLETTTRRATVVDRRVLVSDTVGFVSDLPHDLVESFRTTLGEVRHADVVVLVVDATHEHEHLRSRLETANDVVVEELDGELVVALNKVDAIDDVDAKAGLVEEVTGLAHATVPVSAIDGAGIQALRDAVAEGLPTETAELSLPNDGDGQRHLSWMYDHATVVAVDYGEDVTVSIRGRPSIVERARARADDLE